MKLLLPILFLLMFPSVVHADPMINEINNERIERGIKPLIENSILNKSSLLKCNDMMNVGYFAHFSPKGKAYYNFIWNSGFKGYGVGENLVIEFINDTF